MSEWDLPANAETPTIERIGGGGFLWESGVFKATVKMVYLDQAKSEAVSFNILLENTEGKTLKEAFYIKSGKAKGNKTYYTKDGKDFPLPGYATANSLCVAATGQSLGKCMENLEKKMVNIYNPELRKETPMERPVVMDLVGKQVSVAVHQMTVDKNAKNAAGQYEPTGETRSINECKFFGNADGKTADEILENRDAEMFDKWAAKNTGIVIDKSSKDAAKGSSAADIMGSSAPAAEASSGSLFN